MGGRTDVAMLREMGVRADWAAAPQALRDWVARELSSPVVAARTQAGGFSPGVAARLVCADGTRAFVKAAGVELNAETPDMVRTEGDILAGLPRARHRPELRARYDDGGWVALLLEDVDGRLPTLPWTSPELSRVVDTLGQVAAELTPSPLVGVARAATQLAGFLSGWARIAESAPPDLDPWAARHLDRLVDLEQAFVTAMHGGETLCHIDVRSDNVILAADRVVLVDWNWVAVGPAWLDSLLLGWEIVTAGGSMSAYIAANPLTAALDRDVVLACVVAGAGSMQDLHRRPAPPGLPRIRPWQRRYADALTAWTRGEIGWA